jgi:hypothetical protein
MHLYSSPPAKVALPNVHTPKGLTPCLGSSSSVAQPSTYLARTLISSSAWTTSDFSPFTQCVSPHQQLEDRTPPRAIGRRAPPTISRRHEAPILQAIPLAHRALRRRWPRVTPHPVLLPLAALAFQYHELFFEQPRSLELASSLGSHGVSGVQNRREAVTTFQVQALGSTVPQPQIHDPEERYTALPIPCDVAAWVWMRRRSTA